MVIIVVQFRLGCSPRLGQCRWGKITCKKRDCIRPTGEETHSAGNSGAVEAQKTNAGLREESKTEQRSSEEKTEKKKQTKKTGEGDGALKDSRKSAHCITVS